MRGFRWIILISELVMLALALAVPPVDLPQTAFNEADTPINQATVPVILSCRRALNEVATKAMPPGAPAQSQPARSVAKVEIQHQAHPLSRPLLALLCTLLC
jgi:hypothetical protein